MNSDAETNDGDNPEESADEVTTKGKPAFFMMLTCGFIACLCCIGGTFGGGSLAWMRMANLNAVLDELGAPEGWKKTDSTVTPFSAEATLRGASNPGDIQEWLTDLGVEVADVKVDKCLGSKAGCTLNDVEVGGFAADIHYGSDKDAAEATVQIN